MKESPLLYCGSYFLWNNKSMFRLCTHSIHWYTWMLNTVIRDKQAIFIFFLAYTASKVFFSILQYGRKIVSPCIIYQLYFLTLYTLIASSGMINSFDIFFISWQLKKDIAKDLVHYGAVDTWLVWKLTKGTFILTSRFKKRIDNSMLETDKKKCRKWIHLK